MKTVIPRRSGVWGILILMAGIALSSQAHATDCYRYVSFDGTLTQVDVDCAEQLGVTPIFVRDALNGYDIVVPPMSGTASPYSLLPAASMQWLSTASHLNAAIKVIDFAENTSEIFPLTSEGGEAKIEYVNYTLASWLNTSGATTAIASIASNSNLSGSLCSMIQVCSSCEQYHCIVEWHSKCWCALAGQDCCVIKKLEPPEL